MVKCFVTKHFTYLLKTKNVWVEACLARGFINKTMAHPLH